MRTPSRQAGWRTAPTRLRTRGRRPTLGLERAGSPPEPREGPPWMWLLASGTWENSTPAREALCEPVPSGIPPITSPPPPPAPPPPHLPSTLPGPSGSPGPLQPPWAGDRGVPAWHQPPRHQAPSHAFSVKPRGRGSRQDAGPRDRTPAPSPGCRRGPPPHHVVHPPANPGAAPARGRAVSHAPRSCERRGWARWHLLFEKVFIFPLAQPASAIKGHAPHQVHCAP